MHLTFDIWQLTTNNMGKKRPKISQQSLKRKRQKERLRVKRFRAGNVDENEIDDTPILNGKILETNSKQCASSKNRFNFCWIINLGQPLLNQSDAETSDTASIAEDRSILGADDLMGDNRELNGKI